MTLSITIPNPTLADTLRARKLMESHLDDVKRVTDGIRAKHAKKALQSQFPDHGVAVFARTWETDQYYLMQLLSSAETTSDIDFEDGGFSTLAVDQMDAVRAAEGAICAIGSDDDIWEHLLMPDAEHEGWYEFILPLNDDADLTDAPVRTDVRPKTKEAP